MSKTRDEAISYLYGATERFAAKAQPIFELNGWTWGIFREGARVPTVQDIQGTVSTLIWECTKSGGQNCASTGRIQVFVRQTDRGDWLSGIELVPVSERNH